MAEKGASVKKKTTVDDQAAPRVIITVSGGVADVLCKPRGIALTILDYDLDGSDERDPRVTRDPDGQLCSMGEWPAKELVIGNKHWPMVRQARRDVAALASRRWICPNCKRVVRRNYDELAEAGSPYCPDCETEMNLA